MVKIIHHAEGILRYEFILRDYLTSFTVAQYDLDVLEVDGIEAQLGYIQSSFDVAFERLRDKMRQDIAIALHQSTLPLSPDAPDKEP